jgi:hypothetical protein
MDETFQMALGRTLSNLTEIWLAVAYVVCMFAVIAFRPQRVTHRELFRWSYLLFAIYLLLPVIADGFLRLGAGPGTASPSRPFGEQPAWGSIVARILTNIVARCLLAVSICLGLASLTHGTSEARETRVGQ